MNNELQEIIQESWGELRAMEKKRKFMSVYGMPSVPKRMYNYDQFIRAVCSANSIKVEQVKSESRERYIVDVRFILYFYLSKHFKLTRVFIAFLLGGKEQSSVTYGIQQAEKYEKTDSEFKRKKERAEELTKNWRVK